MIVVGKCNLSVLLRRHGMTFADLQALTGLSKTQISGYANRHHLMSLPTAKLIAEILHCQIDDLYEWHRASR